MSFDGAASIPALARMAEIRSRFAPPRPAPAATPASSIATSTSAYAPTGLAVSSSSFANALAKAQSSLGSAATTASRSTTATTPGTAPVLTDATPYAALFKAAGATYGVDPSLLAAVAKVESGFNPTATSSAGAQGLMQFMPTTSSGMGVDPWDPASSIDGAARLLRSHIDRFGSVDLALAAYNAGPGNVTKYGGVPPFAQTQAYVAKVLALAPQGAS